MIPTRLFAAGLLALIGGRQDPWSHEIEGATVHLSAICSVESTVNCWTPYGEHDSREAEELTAFLKLKQGVCLYYGMQTDVLVVKTSVDAETVGPEIGRNLCGNALKSFEPTLKFYVVDRFDASATKGVYHFHVSTLA